VDRTDRIAGRIAAVELIVRSVLFAGARPDDMFGAVFFDLRKKAKDLKEKWSQEAAKKLEGALLADLAGSNVPVISFKLSLGQYRGSRFVTSAKLSVRAKDEKSVQSLLKHLQTKYSPKFKLKSFEGGVADYNVR